MAVRQIVTQESINPNIIPMIDIMFLILLFFMLSADMGNRELEEVILPLADNVQEDKDSDGKSRPITVNCYHDYDVNCSNYGPNKICVDDNHWRIGIRG